MSFAVFFYSKQAYISNTHRVVALIEAIGCAHRKSSFGLARLSNDIPPNAAHKDI
jgi:hypothetical protein